MNDVLEISSDSDDDTIIFSTDQYFVDKPERDIDPHVESLVNKYISENYLQSDDEEITEFNNKELNTSEDLDVPLIKKLKTCDGGTTEAVSKSSSLQDETISETAALQMLSEKYKYISEDNFYENGGKCTIINVKSLNDKELRKQEKERQKQEKALEREQKKKEIEREKSLKQALTEANRNLKPTECMKFICVGIDRDIIGEEYGNEIINALETADVKYKVHAQIFPHTITWTRQIQSHLMNDDGKLVLSSNDQDTDEVLLIMNCNEFVDHVHKNSLSGYIQSLKSVLLNKRVTLAVYDLGSYIRYQKNQKHTEMRAQITDENKTQQRNKTNFKDFPKVSKRSMEYALTELQLLCSCSHRLLDSSQELGLMVAQFTKSVAEIPYKLQKQEKYRQTDWFVAGDNRDCVKVDKNGNGLNRLWNQMLTAFPLARLETAEAISSKYPTISSLMKAYEDCESTKEAEAILQDIPIRRAAGPLSSSRKIGPEFSKKIYNFLTSVDGNIVL